MKITNVKINNYKSIGNVMNDLTVEKDVTVLVGKNESGKSNVLEALGKINLLRPIEQNYLNNVNRETSGNVSAYITLVFTEDELNSFGVESESTIFTFVNTSTVSFTGGLEKLINSDDELIAKIAYLKEQINANAIGLNIGQKEHANKCLSALGRITNVIIINYYDLLKPLYEWVESSQCEEKRNILNSINTLIVKRFSNKR